MFWFLLACSGDPIHTGSPPDETAEQEDSALIEEEEDVPRYQSVSVSVTLDGTAVEGAVVSQGGNPERWTTGSDGTTSITIDNQVEGDLFIMGSHPDARIGGGDVEDGLVVIELESFDASDNDAYIYQDPGEPERRGTTAQCAHCHVTQNADWYDTPHRSAASGVPLHDLYAGVATALGDASSCADAGGQWWTGIGPGTAAAAERCYLGDGVLPALNEDCGEASPCDSVATEHGGCADCHAPGIDGARGGRDLLEATGHAYDYGVHCDVCHQVESVDLTEPPGVAGRLNIVRPSEKSTSPTSDWDPLTFGPLDDVVNPRMGAVARDHFRTAGFCAGCHEHYQPVLLPGVTADPARWPDGTLPIQTTYSEWAAGPFADKAACQSCHMPPDSDSGNAADVDLLPETVLGIAGGWWRTPGEVRRHTWTGPRSDVADMLRLAAGLRLETERDGDELVVSVTTRNVGPGHAIPTGEPMRSMVLVVSASCDGAPLSATGGAAIPDFGGYYAMKEAGEDWSRWPGAAVGQRVQVVSHTGSFIDYTGTGPFGDGTFDAAGKGMAEEQPQGGALITAVDGETVTFDTPLPAGDVAYLIDAPTEAMDGGPVAARAGLPGFGFARVLAGADGARMVPHFLAADVVSDNRLLPQDEWTSTHRFDATCDDPAAGAVLLYRAYPLALAAERGWSLTEQIMAEVTR